MHESCLTDSDDSDSMCLIQNNSTSLTDSLKERRKKKKVEFCVHTMCRKCKTYFGKDIYFEGVESWIHYSLIFLID